MCVHPVYVQTNSEFVFAVDTEVVEVGPPQVEAVHLGPVDHLPPVADVVGASVLVAQVVRVLPHVDDEDRFEALRHGRVLVNRTGEN